MNRDRLGYALAATLLAAVIAAGCSTGASTGGSKGPANAAAYYKGKTITWIVPYSPGGGFDTVSRLVAPYFSHYTGAKVVVLNKPGAGGLVGVNEMAVAPPTGLTVALVNGPGAVATDIAKAGGVKKAQGMHFDVRKLSWIGRMTSHVDLVYVSPKSPFKTVQDVLRSHRTLRWGASGPGSSEYITGLALETAFNKRFKIITGFKGATQTRAAVVRQELDMSNITADAGSASVRAGSIRPLLILSDKPYTFLPNVPTLEQIKGSISPKGFTLLEELANSVNATGRGLATEPGVPRDRVEFLSTALKKAIDDPQLAAKAKSHGYLLSYLSGAQELALYKQAAKASAIRALILRSFGKG